MKTENAIIGELVEHLNQISDMTIGDGLDYCRSLTDPRPMTGHELESQAAAIRGFLLSIHEKARAAVRQVLISKKP